MTMTAPKFIEIDGKRYLWRDVVKLRQEQRLAAAKAQQPPLFELRDDCRPVSERTAAGRYREPSLFSFFGHGRSARALKQQHPQEREPES